MVSLHKFFYSSLLKHPLEVLFECLQLFDTIYVQGEFQGEFNSLSGGLRAVAILLINIVKLLQ